MSLFCQSIAQDIVAQASCMQCDRNLVILWYRFDAIREEKLATLPRFLEGVRPALTAFLASSTYFLST